MKKLVLNLVAFGILSLMTSIVVNAQLFEPIELYPNTNVIKGKYYSGSGGGGYWSLKYVDSIGRIIRMERYHKKQMMTSRKIVYDDKNNKIYDIHTSVYNNPNRVDTIRFEYNYDNNRIVYQFHKHSDNDSTVIKLTENQGDTLLKYQKQAFYYRPISKKTDVFETTYTLKYQNGLLISKKAFDKTRNSTELRKYEYYDNGRLKRRLIERTPKPKLEGTYVGGPGSDDESFKYKLDSQGRVKVFYKIINGKKFKIAGYKYE